MADRYDVLVVVPPRVEGGKSVWQKIGAAFAQRNGGYAVELVAMPAPLDGRWRFVLLEPRPQQGNDRGPPTERQVAPPQRSARPAPFDDDETPPGW